jgi:hypothetical protein
MDWSEFFQKALDALSSWQPGSWIGLVVILVGLLTQATKLPPFATWLIERKQWRVVIAAVLGLLTGLFTALAAGQNVLGPTLVGLVSGLASSGVSELFTVLSAKKQLERKVGAKMVKAWEEAPPGAELRISWPPGAPLLSPFLEDEQKKVKKTS